MITTKIHCPHCGAKNDEDAKICEECHALLAHEEHEEPVGLHGVISCSDQTIGLIITFVGVVMLVAAIVPFFLLETKDLITLGRMRLIVSLPLGFIAILLLVFGSAIYYGCKRRNVELGKIEEGYRTLAEDSKDAVFTIDGSGRFTYLNDRAADIIGYEKEDLLGSNFLLTIAPEYREPMIENFKKRLTQEEADQYEIEVLTKDGKRKRVELTTKTLEHKGEFMGVEGIARKAEGEKKK